MDLMYQSDYIREYGCDAADLFDKRIGLIIEMACTVQPGTITRPSPTTPGSIILVPSDIGGIEKSLLAMRYNHLIYTDKYTLCSGCGSLISSSTGESILTIFGGYFCYHCALYGNFSIDDPEASSKDYRAYIPYVSNALFSESISLRKSLSRETISKYDLLERAGPRTPLEGLIISAVECESETSRAQRFISDAANSVGLGSHEVNGLSEYIIGTIRSKGSIRIEDITKSYNVFKEDHLTSLKSDGIFIVNTQRMLDYLHGVNPMVFRKFTDYLLR